MSNAGTALQKRQGLEAQTHEIGRPIHPTHPLIKEGLNQIYTSPEGILLMRQTNIPDGARIEALRRYIQLPTQSYHQTRRRNLYVGCIYTFVSHPAGNSHVGRRLYPAGNSQPIGMGLYISFYGPVHIGSPFTSVGGPQLLICSHAWWGWVDGYGMG